MARGGRRTYTRDSRGRFASAPGGGLGAARKAARSQSGRASTLGARTSLKKSRAKLKTNDPADQRLSTALSIRAQKGAVTRGSRGLKAAKVAAQTRISGGAKTVGTVKKAGAKKLQTPSAVFRPGKFKRLKAMQGVSYEKAKLKPVAPPVDKQATKTDAKDSSNPRFRPGEFYRGNFRPRNTTSKPVTNENPFLIGKGTTKYRISASNDDKAARLSNVKTAQRFFESQGLRVSLKSNKNSTSVASYNLATKDININRSHSYWINPASAAKSGRASGEFSSSSPTHTLYHELGHARDKNISNRIGPFGNMWILATRQGPSQKQREQRASSMEGIAKRVSRYATISPSEFIAETYAGRRTGRKYDHQVMDAYREAKGLSSLRLRSQKPLRRKSKP